MSEIEIRPNCKIALRVWWSIAWRASICGVVAGGLMKLALNYLGRDNENVVLMAMAVSLVFSVGIEVWLIWHALTHHYGSFRIAVLKKESLEP
jgi:hypothetical protein